MYVCVYRVKQRARVAGIVEGSSPCPLWGAWAVGWCPKPCPLRVGGAENSLEPTVAFEWSGFARLALLDSAGPEMKVHPVTVALSPPTGSLAGASVPVAGGTRAGCWPLAAGRWLLAAGRWLGLAWQGLGVLSCWGCATRPEPAGVCRTHRNSEQKGHSPPHLLQGPRHSLESRVLGLDAREMSCGQAGLLQGPSTLDSECPLRTCPAGSRGQQE